MSEVTIKANRHYQIDKIPEGSGVEFLREMFLDGQANHTNFCLYSTSGVHGSYLSLEDVERSLGTDDPETLTVLVIQPRLVRMIYGDVRVSRDDIEFLKALQSSSKEAIDEYF